MKELINIYAQIFKGYLDDFILNKFDCPEPLKEACVYSITNGGKRLRPMLCFLGAEFMGKSCENVADFAIAIEMIHSYSLVHDDLPCMDNDTLRRGNPTTHIKYGEDMAVLAGDALLNTAFEILFDRANSSHDILACSYIAKYAGTTGMVGGQCIDVSHNNSSEYDEKTLLSMYSKKTSGLLIASLLSGATACGCTREEQIDLVNFADYMGIAYQIVDDILDCTSSEDVLGKNIGSDIKDNKPTFVQLYGLDYAKQKAKDYTQRAVNCLKKYGERSTKLIELCHYLVDRKF